MQHRAILDADGVYLGHEPAPEDFEFLPDAPPPLSPDCDLEPGLYQWNGQTFVPVRPTTPDNLVNERHTLVAIMLGFEDLETAGLVEFNDVTRQWLDWYRQTFDAKGYVRDDAKGAANGDA